MGQANGKEKGDSGSQTVDGGALIPQGVYTGAQDYNHGVVKTLIQNRKIAPFYPGLDDEKAYSQAPFNTECPICFLYYPSPLNHTRCCAQPICTECFVQIKRADPNHTNPPSSEPATCPFCQETNFGIVYKPPNPKNVSNAAGVAESASAAREQAENIAEGSIVTSRRKSFTPDDPKVVTIDTIRPDWQAKLLAAEAAISRRANRRIIMRQVGDRLIPVGVSSSRLGADLPPGSSTGPGGAIIIGENSRWGFGNNSSLIGNSGGIELPRSTGRGRRSELAQFLQSLGGGPDMEEMMMMEAMRLSLLEHEEQQRRQAQENQNEQAQTTQTRVNSSTTGASPPSPESLRPRMSSLQTETIAPATTTTNVTAQQLGFSSNTMAELSELIEGAPPPPPPPPPAVTADNTTNSREVSTIEDSEPLSLEQEQRRQSFNSSSPPIATPKNDDTNVDGFNNDITNKSTASAIPSTNAAIQTSPIGSPSRIGTNPNNPFRRMANSPAHSRSGSTAN